jgi:hypothetical protein
MQTLTKVFGPQVAMFFTTETKGVSISEVSRRQAEAKQHNDEFWGKIQDAVAGFFQKVLSFVGAGTSMPQTLDVVTVSQNDLAAYNGVAERNANTAILMHGVKLFKRLQEQLQSMDLTLFAVESMPVAPERPEAPEAPLPPARTALGTLCGTDAFMELANIDEIIAQLKPQVLEKFDFAFFKRANGLNSRAAALGKLLSEQGSFFRQLIKPLPKGGEQLTQNGVVITSWKRAYSEEQLKEFAEFRDTLQSEYNNLQMQLNGCKKQIKDAVRAYNLQQERLYQEVYSDYMLRYAEYQTAIKKQSDEYRQAVNAYAVDMERVRSSAETLRQQALAELADLRVRAE